MIFQACFMREDRYNTKFIAQLRLLSLVVREHNAHKRCFLDFPAELRNEIYKHLVVVGKDIIYTRLVRDPRTNPFQGLQRVYQALPTDPPNLQTDSCRGRIDIPSKEHFHVTLLARVPRAIEGYRPFLPRPRPDHTSYRSTAVLLSRTDQC